ncbi:MAG: site-2 protease family protein [Deltaproteobacteria bacterium]|nr:MAG: site-2 protease family protein [Deltaproteobacteria bacterium]
MEDIILRICTQLPGLLFGIVFHEYAHAWAATKFGDNTAKLQGRLTLNPAAHYTLFGTIIFPLLGAAFGGIMFGWAKPVPIDGRNLKEYRKGIFWISFAGPLANIILGMVSALFYAIFLTQVGQDFYLYGSIVTMLEAAVYINFILAFFNLIPFPPLDGSRMVTAFLNYEQARKYEELQRYGFIFLVLLWTTPILGYILSPAYYLARGSIGLFFKMMA